VHIEPQKRAAGLRHMYTHLQPHGLQNSIIQICQLYSQKIINMRLQVNESPVKGLIAAWGRMLEDIDLSRFYK
jgi:hypothetical protein